MNKPIYKLSRSRSTILISLLFVAIISLHPGMVQGQSDLTVPYVSGPPTAWPGAEILIEFHVENVGPAPTIISGITNFVFIWDTANNTSQDLLSPTDTHIAHTLRPLLPGEIDIVGPISVFIPSDMPLDTVITIAVLTDYADTEPELFEDNNMALILVAIEPREIPFDPLENCTFDVIEQEYYDDVYQFYAPLGSSVYAEIIAERLGSTLDPLLILLEPPDIPLSSEESTESIGLDSRLGYVGLPYDGYFRLMVYGQDSTLGMYDLCLQQAVPEVENNDDFTVATPINVGNAVVGSFDVPGDVDYYLFSGSLGDVLYVDFTSDEGLETPPDSIFDPMAIVYNSSGDTLLIEDDVDDYDPYFHFVLPQTDDYYIGVTDAPGDGLGGGYPGYNYMFKLWQLQGAVLPDLQPMNVVPLTPPVHAGDTVLVDFETWNTGGLNTFGGGVSVNIWLSTDAAIDPLVDSLLAVGDFEGDVDLGSFVPTQVSVPISVTTIPGAYFLGIVLDPTDYEVEGDETNNTTFLPVDIEPPTGISDRRKFPDAFALLQNYPNPLSSETNIAYQVPKAKNRGFMTVHVTIEIYNVLGQRVAVLVDQPKTSGRYNVKWDGRMNGRSLAAGVYMYRMRAGSFVETKRLVIVR